MKTAEVVGKCKHRHTTLQADLVYFLNKLHNQENFHIIPSNRNNINEAYQFCSYRNQNIKTKNVIG